MDVVYVVPSHFPEMTPTPGQLLAAELARLGVKRSQLADMLNVNWPTVDRWTKDNGFTKKNQERAAIALGLQPDRFQHPPATVQHRKKCKKAFEEFLASPLAPPDITEAEKVALQTQQVPLAWLPTVHFYVGLLFLMRNQLQPSEFAAEVTENEELARQAAEKMSKTKHLKPPARPKGMPKGAKGRPRPRE